MDAPIQGGLSAHQEQALSARLISSHQDVTPAATTTSWTPAMGLTAVARAESWLGMPYSWAGGSASGPTPGQCAPGTGGDLDCHVVGFDCSGLTMYAWGAYTSLPHLAAAQRNAGLFHPSLTQLLPGDLVFFSGYLPGGTGHVAIYTGHGLVIEAPQSGEVTRRAKLSDLISSDGTYRGAVRPLTGQTPTLTAPAVTISPAGGTVTLHGANLAAVTAVHIGKVTVQKFVQRSTSAIVLLAPAHPKGKVAVTVSTSWLAQSQPVTLTYAKPRPATPVSAPTHPVTAPTVPVASPTSQSTPTAPASPVSSSAPAPAPTPSSTAPVPPTSSSSTTAVVPPG